MAKKTNDEFIKEVYNLVKDEYTFMEEYINTKTPITVIHNKCGNIYKVRPDNFLQGYRCPECRKKKISKKLSSDTKTFKKRVFEKVGDEYSVLGEYINNKTKILMKHNKCGNEFLVTPEMFIGKKARRCPKCKLLKLKEHFSYSTEEFKEKYVNNTEYELLDEYINTNTKINFKHKKCNKIFKMRPNDFQQGQRCPYCLTKSKGELKIRKILEENNIYFEEQFKINNCKNKRLLPFDFKLETIDGDLILIEYDGKQHFNESFYGNNLEEQIKRDNIKNDFCNKNKINLIRISYLEYKKLDKIISHIIQSYKLKTISSQD